MEVLAATLGDIITKPGQGADIFEPEIVVVQSVGMGRWVSMCLARQNQISANIQMPFPNGFIRSLMGEIIGTKNKNGNIDKFDRTVMALRLMDIIPQFLEKPDFKEIKGYLADDENGVKLFQLSLMISRTFDQYLVFRHDMITRWDKGDFGKAFTSNASDAKKGSIDNFDGLLAEAWQGQLFQKLSELSGGDHSARHKFDFFKKIANPNLTESLKTNLPNRVFVFGISYLPPFHLEIFSSLSTFMEVNLFFLNPCREFWGDILTDKEGKRIKKKAAGVDVSDLHLDPGNRLLNSMGGLGRDFFFELTSNDFEIFEYYSEPEDDPLLDSGMDCKTMLAAVQTDILNLSEGTTGKISPDDSISFHSCHGPMREMEVLNDNLLKMFENDKSLKPNDVIVMTPDIERYAPYVKAVFGNPEDKSMAIPFGIADKSLKSVSSLIETFFAILELKSSRLTNSQVFSICRPDCVRSNFSLTSDELDTLNYWTREAGIRWGMNSEHRKNQGLPQSEENTWLHGIKRLLTGYAMADDGLIKDDIAPYCNIEGSGGLILGRFLDFAEMLFSVTQRLAGSKSVKDWCSLLREITVNFFEDTPATARDLQKLIKTIDTFDQAGKTAEFKGELDLDAIKKHMSEAFSAGSYGSGFISGGVTFCAMLPMRSIPFKVICLVGMNSDSFPRSNPNLSFDLMAKKPRRLDRSKRSDDKYLFLETIVSARQRLYISWTGRSIQDNSEIQPSVLVSDLMDYLTGNFGIDETKLTKIHRLQAFSKEYFRKDSELFSYSKDNFEAAIKNSTVPGEFFREKLKKPPEEFLELTIDDLFAFFRNPAKYIVNNRLGARLEIEGEIEEESEAFVLDGLEKYKLKTRLLDVLEKQGKPEMVFKRIAAEGVLPHGTGGELEFLSAMSQAESIQREIEKQAGGSSKETFEESISLNGFNLRARINDLYDRQIIMVFPSKEKSKNLLKTWLYHLFMKVADDDYKKPSLAVSTDKTIAFDIQDNSEVILANLLDIYFQGLSMPLHFFVETSFKYASTFLGKKPENAISSAAKTWHGNDYTQSEKDDPYYQLCFGRTKNLFDKQFTDTALLVFKDMIENKKKI